MNDLPQAKRNFFNMAIADIYRAIRGRSLMGAFTLSACAIDAMAYMYHANHKDEVGKNFTGWVSAWITKPLNGNCDPEVLYALRCGLVHTYGYAQRMAKQGVKGYLYWHNNPQLHWAEDPVKVYNLNLESHVAELTIGAFNFFDSCADGSARARTALDRAQKLMRIYSANQPPGTYTTMDPALACLDGQEEPRIETLIKEIQRIYA